jgi:hypothetical protein
MENKKTVGPQYYKTLKRNMLLIMILVSCAPLLLIAGIILYQFQISYQQEITMKDLGIIGMLVVFTLTNSIAISEADAQERKYWRDSVGQGYRGEYQGKYNPKTVTTVKGVVETVEQMPPATGMSYGIHLDLRTASGTLSVHLGPAWFIERQDIRIEEGDTLQVKGSKITYEGKPTIIAAEVKKGNTVLKLRDQNGFPVWAGTR